VEGTIRILERSEEVAVDGHLIFWVDAFDLTMSVSQTRSIWEESYL
jgi:hypothetical protein